MFRCIFEDPGRRQWEDLLARAPRASLQQSFAYGVAVSAQGHMAHRAVIRDGREPVALLQLAVRRFRWLPGLRLALAIYGPVWLDGEPDGQRLAQAMDAVCRTLEPGLLLWTPDVANPIPGLGRRRVMTGASTGVLDLRLPPAELEARLSGKWRNMLRRAREAPLAVVEARAGALLDWLLDTNEAHRRRVGYRGPHRDFYQALAAASHPRRDRLVLIARYAGEPVAGVWMQRHGRDATYLVGATTESGRRLRAHHLLLFEAMLRLRERGVERLDLGGIDTVTAPGVARFKLGTGCAVRTFAGTYLLSLPGRHRASAGVPAAAPLAARSPAVGGDIV
ncbi:hypothetical protein HRbin40_00297 [bacterium HR40]|nr:hypothetical protein HRbin40_00297 [bacterium HR40]